MAEQTGIKRWDYTYDGIAEEELGRFLEADEVEAAIESMEGTLRPIAARGAGLAKIRAEGSLKALANLRDRLGMEKR